MDTESFIVQTKTDGIYKDIVKYVDKFGTSNYELDRPCLKEKKKK